MPAFTSDPYARARPVTSLADKADQSSEPEPPSERCASSATMRPTGAIVPNKNYLKLSRNPAAGVFDATRDGDTPAAERMLAVAALRNSI